MDRREIIPSEEARRRLPAMLRSLAAAEDRPAGYVIGRHRKPEAVLLAVDDYERLLAASRDQGRDDPSTLLRRHRDAVLETARRHGAGNIRVFGSVARGESGPGSDIDLLVRLEPGRTLFDLGGMISDLEALLGRRVDVVSEAGLTGSVGERILDGAVPL